MLSNAALLKHRSEITRELTQSITCTQGVYNYSSLPPVSEQDAVGVAQMWLVRRPDSFTEKQLIK